jgi:alpha-tubulin suppressor-like RCC1 family protein
VNAPVLVANPATLGSAMSVSTTAADDVAVASADFNVDGGAWTPLIDTSGAFGGTTVGVSGVFGGQALMVATATADSCALLAGGTVRCWGYNYRGQLGDGTTTNRLTATAVQGLSTVSVISMSYSDTCALLADTTVWCWGLNSQGEIGDGTTHDRLTATEVSGLSAVSAIALGGNRACALLAPHGTVECWGANSWGQLGDGTTTDRLTPVPVLGLSAVTAIATGDADACALLADTTVWCWGYNVAGQLGDGTTINRLTPVQVSGLSGVTAISASGPDTCALLALDRTVECWGANFSGQLGNGTTADQATPGPVLGLVGVTAISSGAGDTCALLAGGTVSCWGYNNEGELGDGTTTDQHLPAPVLGLSGVTAIAASPVGYDTCAVLADTTVRCWGANADGELGDGTTTLRTSPVPVANIGPLSVGTHAICARATDSTGNTSDGLACTDLTVGVEGTTAAGTDIVVVPTGSTSASEPVSLTFSSVGTPGTTTLTTSTTAPPLPAGYQVGSAPVYFDLATTASYSGSITVCVSYAGVTPAPTSLLHYDSTLADWVDITTSIHTASQTICGTTSSLSPFGLATWTPPALTVPSNLTTTATGSTGAAVPYSAPTAIDSAGASLTPVCTRASGTTFPVGTTPVTCTATDVLRRTSSASFTVAVVYAFAGFFQPLNDPISATNPMSSFKAGSTIAVKFALRYANGTPIVDSAAAAIATACGATISLVKTSATAGPVDEAVTSATPNSGNCFRYDSTTHQFAFNLGTKGLPTGSQYLLTATIVGADKTLLAIHWLAIGVR